MKMYYVYTHSSGGEVFYVGQSKIRPPKDGCWSHGVKYERAYLQSGKSDLWLKLLGSNPLEVNIISHFHTLNESCQFEKTLIQYFSSKGRIANKAIAKPVFQFNIAGEFIARHISLADAERATGIDQHSILNSIHKRSNRITAGGFIWSFMQKCTPLSKRNISQYDLLGNYINTFNSLGEITRHLNKNSTTAIRNCFTGKQKQAYGYRWVDEGIKELNPEWARRLGFSESRLFPYTKEDYNVHCGYPGSED